LNALIQIAHPYDVEWNVITDRPCGIESVAECYRIPRQRIESNRDNRYFSLRAGQAFRDTEVDAIILLFLRLVTSDIYAVFRTFNIHPSLLPAFPGFRAVESARTAQSQLLGATLHLVDETTDRGPVLTQAVDVVDPKWSVDVWLRVSFRQKVRLGTWLIDFLRSERFADSSRAHARPMRFSTLADAQLSDPVLAELAENWIAQNALPTGSSTDVA
jgi:folate-dependent phosphoribosylglycinamide formyltransferase PurN